MRALIAFDKFKGSLTAAEACAAAARGLAAAQPDWSRDECPLTDGGDGFAALLMRAAGGDLIRKTVSGPRGNPVEAEFGLASFERIPATARKRLGLDPPSGGGALIAVLEMASSSGLALLPESERDPWQTTTSGTGELIRAAADAGAAMILLGAGGSATHDLGIGALAALGLEVVSSSGQQLRPPVPATWEHISRLGQFHSGPLPPIRIATDVRNHLLGRQGAAVVFAPQKGLSPGDVARLEHATARLALMLCDRFSQPDTLMDIPGSGAAGGLPFGLMAGVGAELVPGFDLVADWLDLDARIAAADVILTGEGRFDQSSLGGKGPGGLIHRSRDRHHQVHVFAGAIEAVEGSNRYIPHVINPDGQSDAAALTQSGIRLETAVRAVFSAHPSRSE